MTGPSIAFQARWEGALTQTLVPRWCLWTHNFLNTHILPATYLPTATRLFEETWDSQETPSNLWFDPCTSFSTLKDKYIKIILKITTPDGVELTGVHYKFRHQEETQPPPTVIFFDGNGGDFRSGWHSFLQYEAIRSGQPLDVVVFDYRGCHESEDIASCDGLVIDGHSVYQYVRDCCHVPEDKISLYGLSLGGGVVGRLKPLLTTHNGKVVIDRSFDSLGEVIFGVVKEIANDCLKRTSLSSVYGCFREFLTAPVAYFLWMALSPFLLAKEGFDYISNDLFSTFVSSSCAYVALEITKLHSWVMNTKDTVRESPNHLFLYHRNDTIIPFERNLANQRSRKIELFGDSVRFLDRAIYPNAHCIPLNHLRTASDTLASREVFQFIVN